MSVAKWRRGWLRRARASRIARARCQSGQAVWGGSEVDEVDEGMRRAEWLCRGHHFPQSSMTAVRVPGLAISRHRPGSLGSKRALATPARRFSTRHTLGDRPLSWLRARPPRWRCHVLVLGQMAVLVMMVVMPVLVLAVLVFLLMAAVCLSSCPSRVVHQSRVAAGSHGRPPCLASPAPALAPVPGRLLFAAATMY
jgi:hypothetical protein